MKRFHRSPSSKKRRERSIRKGKRTAAWERGGADFSPEPYENHYETLRCLKYGRLYGVISSEAYESGKIQLLARL